MDKLTERLANLAAYNCWQVIDEGHPLSVEAVGGSENLVFEVHCAQGDVGLIIGKHGRNIDAMRTLVGSACRGANIRTGVEVLDSRRKTRGQAMKDLGLSVTVPVCLVIAFCGLAAVLGADPWVMLTVAAVCLPIVGYVVFAIFTVWWAIKVGDVGVHQNMPFQSKFYFSHGMSVVLTIVLAAAGSFILFFVLNVRGMTSGAL